MLAFALIAGSMMLVALPIRVQAQAKTAASAVRSTLRETVQQAVTHRGYMFMTLAFFACGFQLVFITSYLPSYLELCGIAPGVGATALALIGLFNAIGTYVFGQLGARFSQKRLLALIYLMRTLIIAGFLLLPVSATTTLVFAAAMGLLWLGVVPLVTGIIGRMFGLTYFNTLYGIAFLSHQVGSFVGAWMGGVVFDLTARYDIAWAALIVIGVTAFLLQWTMDERPPRPRTAPAVAPA
jgi:predicted MFS family arabinose efflux permease